MKDNILQELENELGQGRIKVNEPMSAHTTFQIGGPADFYIEAGTVDDIAKIVTLAKEVNLPFFILGGGSNILVGDKGIRGLVIKNNSRQIKIKGYSGKVEKGKLETGDVMIEVDAGVPFNQLVRFTLEEGFEGFEEFLGIPGTVGGAVSVNAHWHGKRVRDFVVSQKDIENVLLSVVFRLKKGESKDTLWQKAQESIDLRREKHPTNPSAGCVFQNIQKSEAIRIGTANFTTSTAFLIDASGLKGKQIENVQISPKHANFMINLGGGKASDVLELIDIVKQEVYKKFKVRLKEEILKIGEF